MRPDAGHVVTANEGGPLRIVSLLPSATEIVYALGLEDRLVGVTHECAWPPAAAQKRHVSHTSIPADATSAEIDALVTQAVQGGPPTTWLDDEAVRELAPDLILTQDLCAVCAVPAGQVDEALRRLDCSAEVVSLDPSTLTEVLDGILRVGAATGRDRRAAEVRAQLQERLTAVARAVAGRRRPRVFALEWADPPFNAGHWVPEMIELAGGTPVLASPAAASARVSWAAIEQAAPEVLVFMPCGHPMATAVREARDLLLPRPELAAVPVVVAAHGDAYFSRPGPRLVDGVEILAGLLHPDAWPAPEPAAARVLRG